MTDEILKLGLLCISGFFSSFYDYNDSFYLLDFCQTRLFDSSLFVAKKDNTFHLVVVGLRWWFFFFFLFFFEGVHAISSWTTIALMYISPPSFSEFNLWMIAQNSSYWRVHQTRPWCWFPTNLLLNPCLRFACLPRSNDHLFYTSYCSLNGTDAIIAMVNFSFPVITEKKLTQLFLK